ncbi:tol-pal system-associated acyl-CoA thioesterase [Methylorubrum rhodesianum]|jgi:acyl-CoA thioester hydrolase|uniref:Tol-pal system-associated acyl-CoA thioesterase n=1 Tax=Methylorubrum rhodesianum TaxID=29427 RepID=A0ABU9ZJE2_9HYPH|nr:MULTISPECIES: tol-pal system-associated acyl-CoA thioesterase [Methylorubrum]MBB5764266.1 acyl-CoA thioester hydrolase [Methylorubrum rhodesianum]MBI1690040.1 tol-pal system-associated acyl-CoA thioesterase [Methylorubrum sp. DB1722]MBK3402521.1 tol-pal system-associated acyl-CoA thioesterase [Methylorubrum rhodesianum]MBY0141555.1 tol-pal system-associated acyl-CoA thioesterase [Methylorubrum populi]
MDPMTGADAHRLPLRVYYEDTDFSGFVYHASYLRFMERGRTELLRSLAGDQSDLHADGAGLVFVVRRMTLDYLKPARMDDLIEVHTRTSELRGASMHLAQEVRRGEDVLVRAEVVVACVRNGRAIRLPESLRRTLTPSAARSA